MLVISLLTCQRKEGPKEGAVMEMTSLLLIWKKQQPQSYTFQYFLPHITDWLLLIQDCIDGQ